MAEDVRIGRRGTRVMGNIRTKRGGLLIFREGLRVSVCSHLGIKRGLQ